MGRGLVETMGLERVIQIESLYFLCALKPLL